MPWNSTGKLPPPPPNLGSPPCNAPPRPDKPQDQPAQMALAGVTPTSGFTRDSTPTHTPAREAASPKATRNGAHTHLTPSPDPLATLSPDRLPSGPAPPLRPLPTPATPPPRQPPPPTMTPGPPHCVADAPPTTSPIAPSPAATLGAEPWTPASTRPESMLMCSYAA
ncbi:hypothetical protein C0989_012387 [Termitomyces sp. Mn162]|nr:hypothetical protein C0989_012387 [Termitomyces sp. Mn162]